jgi:hypothetical protein
MSDSETDLAFRPEDDIDSRIRRYLRALPRRRHCTTMNLREGHRQEMGRVADVPSTTGNGGDTDRAASSQNVIATSLRSIAR